MTDYFNDYNSFATSKVLPSPADTPYETPGFIRSKRSSRATLGSSREESPSPPPLPPDAMDLQNQSRESRVDPRRFTPNLHASLVHDILKLRGELESKNNLVENLETSLATARQETETLNKQLADSKKETRKAKRVAEQIETGTYEAVDSLAKERDAARTAVEELRTKLSASQKATRQQDEETQRTLRIWESEKEKWDNERRQLEVRLHVTESRLRTFVDELSQQQSSAEARVQVEHVGNDSVFKDSGLGNESDTASVRSPAGSPIKHRRQWSGLSHSSSIRRRGQRGSTSDRNVASPEPSTSRAGFSLADELGMDDEDELDDFDHADEELDYPEITEHARQSMESRQSNAPGEVDSKAKRVLGLSTDSPGSLQDAAASSKQTLPALQPAIATPAEQPFEWTTVLPTLKEEESRHSVHYVDAACQPSPPPSPVVDAAAKPANVATLDATNLVATSPLSPPESPHVDEEVEPLINDLPEPRLTYSTASTQTDDLVKQERPITPATFHRQRDSLSPPSAVPAIAIHPPNSRPPTPQNYVLPPRTRNASTQANIATPWPSRSVSVQTEEIRIDRRPFKLPPHLMPSHLLPSPVLSEPGSSRRASEARMSDLFAKSGPLPDLMASPSSVPSVPAEPSPMSLQEESPKDLRMPLRVLPLPRPTLSPVFLQNAFVSDGPLNRSASYGVTKPAQIVASRLMDIDKDSDLSDGEFGTNHDIGAKLYSSALPGISRKLARSGLLDHPKPVPEDKEVSPERRPATADSVSAAPAPSISSSRNEPQRTKGKQPIKSSLYKSIRSRSPSFGSLVSSSYSANARPGVPPYPIPTRSSSRVLPNSLSEGSQSPTPVHGGSSSRGKRSLRKVQSANAMRNGGRKSSPVKPRRRRRSPELTPVQSMAFDSPGVTRFPIPEIPTALPERRHERLKSSTVLEDGTTTARSSTTHAVPEPNLVDAIAATMVGEWMLKYIRKRKSFGVGEAEFSLTGDDGAVGNGTHGSRHKRWVWLSPYERCIMWDTKQPTSGNALLGKKGRKLAIQSVLDVQDETPAPRNNEFSSAFNRSILILTPERALKFTAVTHERHALWMTALAFLADSGRLPSHMSNMPAEPPVPALPSIDTMPAIPQQPTSFARGHVRDSIRLAKGKRPEIPKKQTRREPEAFTGTMSAALEDALHGDNGADFPAVPRLYVGTTKHQRNRSNTSPRVPTAFSGLRSFSSNGAATSTSSTPLPLSGVSRPSGSSKSAGASRQESIATTIGEAPNFFEAVGTVRMAAFVDSNLQDGVLYLPGPPQASQIPPRTAAGVANIPARRRGESNPSQTANDKRHGTYFFDDFDADPFRNF